jgi:tetratricopeptide (TPR) repeat protein
MTPAILTALLLIASPADEARREARARFGYAALLAARELPARALAEIEVAAKLDPDSLEVQRDRLRLYALFGRDADAIRVAGAILKRDPDDVETSQALAKLAHDGRDDKAAVRVLTAALARPGLAKASLRRFGVLRDLATAAAADPVAQELALRGLVAMLTEDVPLLADSPFFDGPKDVAGAAISRREQMADTLTTRKKFAEAEAIYRELQTATGPARLRWNIAGLELARGRPEEALALIAPLPPTPAHEAAFYDRLAAAARQAGPGGEALKRLAEAAAARPRTSPVWWVYAEELGRGSSPNSPASPPTAASGTATSAS